MVSLIDFKQICWDGDINIINSAINDIKLKNEHKEDGNVLNRDYWNNGLRGACSGGHSNIIDLMMKLGANNWNWALRGACEVGNLTMVNLIIGLGADDWNSGLICACYGGHIDVVKLMIEKGANCWNWGLNYACMYNNFDIAKMMINHGANNWDFVFGFSRDEIDPDVVAVMVEKKVCIELYLGYPRDRDEIFKLHKFGMPINNFKNIKGFDDLVRDIEERKRVAKDGLSSHLIKDLTMIVVEYVVN